jgi:hypothetical protein
MKLEIVNRRNVAEVRQLNDDGTITIYLCENVQAALFKIASLVYSIEEPKEEAKRSILVGTFGEKKQPERPNLEEIAKKVAEEMAKQGKFAIQMPPDTLNSPGLGAPVPYINPIGPYYGGGKVTIVPNTIDLGEVTITPEIDVNVGDSDMVDCTGTAQLGETVNLSAILADIQGSQGCFGLQDEPVLTSNGNVKMFKTTLSSHT